MRNGLGAVNRHISTMFMGDFSNLFDRIDIAQNIGDLRQGDNLNLITFKTFLISFQIEVTARF